MSDLSTSTCSLEDYCLKPEDKREMDSILQQVGLTNIMESLKTELHSQMMSGGYKFHSSKVFNKSRRSSKTRSSSSSRSQFSGGAQSSKRVDFLSKMLAVICLFVLQGYTLHNIIMYIGQPATQITSQTCETPISPTTIQAYEYVYDLLSIEFEAISDTWMPENNRCEIQTDKRSLMLRAAHERWGQVSALTQSGVNKTCLARDVEYYSRVYYFCFFIGSIFLHIFKELGYSRPEEFARYLETRPVFKHLGDILTVGQTLMANPLEALSPAAFNRIKDIGGFNAIGAFFSLAIKWMLSAGIFTQRKLFNVFANGFKYLLAGRSTTDTSLEPGAITQVQDIQETQIEEKFEEILQQSDKALLKQVLCAVPVPEKSSRRERIRLSTSEIDEIIDSSAKKTLSRGGNKKRNHKLKTVKRSKKHKLTIKRASTRHNKHKK